MNRVARTQAHPEFATVRSEVKDLLAEVMRNASSTVSLLNQVKKLELPMIFFIDNVICTSRLKFASQWAEKRLAAERNELAGDERFFLDFLEEDLKDTSEEAVERLAVYYVCLGSGLHGHVSKPARSDPPLHGADLSAHSANGLTVTPARRSAKRLTSTLIPVSSPNRRAIKSYWWPSLSYS